MYYDGEVCIAQLGADFGVEIGRYTFRNREWEADMHSSSTITTTLD